MSENCNGVTKVGDPYKCTYQIANILDSPSHDTWHITSLEDTVFGATVGSPPALPSSTTILHDAQLVFGVAIGSPPSPTCVGGTGSGTQADPYIGATSCDMPFGTTITAYGNAATFDGFSFHTVTGADWAATAPSHVLSDTSTVHGTDLCDHDTPPINCPIGDKPQTSGGSTQLVQRVSATATTIHDAAHNPVTGVEVGSTVHDFVQVTTSDPALSQPFPSGNVTLEWYSGPNCQTLVSSTTVTLDPATGTVDATAFAQPVPATGIFGFKAHYLGDNVYLPSDGACEPLSVVDANIQITPANATNPVNTNHTLTGHVNVNDGTGFVNAPAGTTITFQILSGPGSFVGGVNQCTTVGATGSCTVAITSSTAGTTVVRDSTTVSVAGVSLTRSSGDGKAGDSADANKLWVNPDANIQISPATATNATGTNHTLTGHVNVAPDGATFANAPDGTLITFSIVSGPGSFVGGVNTCTTAGGTGSCTVAITSNATGQTVVRAATDVTVNGILLHRETNDGHAGDSSDAQKNWVNANIQISPATASNEVRTNHVLTITVNALGGTIDAGPHTATATILSGPGSFVGSPSCTYTGGAATASCTVTITSSTPGVTVVQATSNIPVNGQTITRTTNTADNTAAGGSGNASKNWVDANITITPQSAQNPTGSNHTLTGHVNVNDGTGFVNAPDGTVINFSLSNAGGATAVFVGPSSCTTAGGTGSCTVVISSPTGGTTTIHATTTVTVNGIPLTRATGDGLPGDSPDGTKTWIPPGGLIAPTQTTCNDVLNNTAQTLGQINYTVTGGKIGQGINPGVFFYYAKITTTMPNQVVTVTQSNTSTNNAAPFGILQGQAWLWSGDCSSKIVGTTSGPNDSAASFTVPVPGNYIIGIKYQTKSIAGTTAPVPADITYTFTSSLGATTNATVLLKKS